MYEEDKLNPGHSGARDVLRVVGPLLVAVGLLFTIAGVVNFFAAFGTFESPRYFWCAFVGLPILGLGAAITKFAFMGRLVRYVAGETAPVAKDTFNYMAEGTQHGVRTMAEAIGEGLRGAGADLPCAKCGQPNETDARFCRKCGASLGTICPSCGRPSDAGASFCDACGKPLTMNANV